MMDRRTLLKLLGLSSAALTYAGAANSIDWNQWREEKFS